MKYIYINISRGLRLYFIVYPDLSHNTDILNYNSSIVLPGDQYCKIWFLYCSDSWAIEEILPSRLSNTGELNFNIIMFSNCEWVNLSKREGKDRVFRGLAGLLRGISWGQRQGFRIGPPEIHRRFRIGPPKIHRWFRIGPPQFFLNLLPP